MAEAVKRNCPLRAQMNSIRLASVDGRSLYVQNASPQQGENEFRYSRPKVIRLLLAEDDDVDRERVQRLLARSRLSCEIIEAPSGKQALEIMRNEAPDCLLLDYHLGDMTGIEVLNQMAQDGVATPVIMITGVGGEELVVTAMRLGVYDYLPKSLLNKDKLSDAIESSLEQAALQWRLIEMQKKLERMSFYDELTGLPNRNLFFDRLEQEILNAERDGSRFALLMMDLNLFKEVNDQLGHGVGDKVLAEIASRFCSVARKSDTISRLGGDEFTCLLHGVESVSCAVAFAEKVVDVISTPLAIDDNVVQVEVSIGICLYPSHGTEASLLLSNADHAMYQAKKSFRDYVVHDAARQKESGRIHVGLHLNRALDHKELYMVYQPKINLMTHEVIALEALVRWRSPELGLVGPAQFIPLAERSALITKLTFAIVDMVLDQMVAWRLQKQLRVPVSINISARLLDDTNLPAKILDNLHRRNLQAADLMVEVTETALASSNELAKRVVAELAAAGIGISIDDFGTGFTSFKYIRDIDISEIKIDRLFVTDLSEKERDASIVRSIALLSDSMAVRVVAEGIESQECQSALTRLGCMYGQGYHIAHPMRADELTRWLQRLH